MTKKLLAKSFYCSRGAKISFQHSGLTEDYCKTVLQTVLPIKRFAKSFYRVLKFHFSTPPV